MKNPTFLDFFDTAFWRTTLGYLTFHILVKVKAFTGKWGKLYTGKNAQSQASGMQRLNRYHVDILKLGNYTFDKVIIRRWIF